MKLLRLRSCIIVTEDSCFSIQCNPWGQDIWGAHYCPWWLPLKAVLHANILEYQCIPSGGWEKWSPQSHGPPSCHDWAGLSGPPPARTTHVFQEQLWCHCWGRVWAMSTGNRLQGMPAVCWRSISCLEDWGQHEGAVTSTWVHDKLSLEWLLQMVVTAELQCHQLWSLENQGMEIHL